MSHNRCFQTELHRFTYPKNFSALHHHHLADVVRSDILFQKELEFRSKKSWGVGRGADTLSLRLSLRGSPLWVG